MAIERYGATYWNNREIRAEVWRTLEPLIIRGGGVEEISNIVEALDRKIVEHVVSSAKEKPFYPVGSIRIVKISKGDSNGGIPDSGNQKIAFARLLFQNNFMPPKTDCPLELMEFCKEHKINLPNNFYDMLRLEVYYAAVILANMGDTTRLEAYNSLGNQVDKEWFEQSLVGEQNTIKAKLDKNWLYANNGPSRWRQPVRVETEGVIFDTQPYARFRQMRRWGMTPKKSIIPDEEPKDTRGRKRKGGNRG